MMTTTDNPTATAISTATNSPTAQPAGRIARRRQLGSDRRGRFSAWFLDRPGVRFKQLVLLIGAIYLGFVSVTNAINVAVTLSGHHDVILNSGNVDYIRSITHAYGGPRWLATTAVVAALLAEGIGALLFIGALRRYRGGRRGLGQVWLALSWNVGLWLAFIVGTEFFVAYGSEGPFRELLAVGLLMAIAIAVVPDAPDSCGD
jgi:hypothetical protein